jgi:hypothetical protein
MDRRSTRAAQEAKNDGSHDATRAAGFMPQLALWILSSSAAVTVTWLQHRVDEDTGS